MRKLRQRVFKYNLLTARKWMNRISNPSLAPESIFWPCLSHPRPSSARCSLFVLIWLLKVTYTFCLIYSSVVSCTIFIVFFFCVKKEKGKTRKRKLQMDFEKLKICGPISLLSVPNLCLKSREQESIVLDYWNIPLECLWQTWHKNSSKGRQTLLGLLLGPVPDFC